MVPLEVFNRQFEEVNEDNQDIDVPFEMAVAQGKMRKRVHKREQCNDYEMRYVELAEQEEKLRYTYDWRTFFNKNLRYKRPYCMNSHLFEEKPSDDGTLPDYDHDMEMGELYSDSSEEPDTEDEKEEEKKQIEQ